MFYIYKKKDQDIYVFISNKFVVIKYVKKLTLIRGISSRAFYRLGIFSSVKI